MMRFRHAWAGGPNRPSCSLAHAIQCSLEDNDGGSVESAARTARNAVQAVAGLIETLHAKGALTDAEAKSFVGFAYEETDA